MELKDLAEKLEKQVTDFRKENDKLLTEVTAAKSGVAEQKEKVEKLNSSITEIEQKLKDTAAAIKRASTPEVLDHSKKRALSEPEKKYREVMTNYLRTAQLVDSMKELATEAYGLKAMSVDSDPSGGFWVTPDTSGRIVQQVYESSPIRQYASVQEISTDSLEGMYDLDQVSSGWVTERASRPVTNQALIGKYRIPVHELYAEPQISQKILDDAVVDIESWLTGKVAQKFARDEAAAFVNGTGVGQPRGFLTYANGTTLPYGGNIPTIQQIGSGSSAAVTADFLYDLIYNLKAVYRKGAAFAMPRLLIDQVRKLKDAYQHYLWEPNFQTGEPGTLAGFPVLEFNDMPAAAANSLSVAFANWKETYQIVDRVGIRVLRDNLTVKGQVLLYTTKRVGGDVVNFESIKLGKLG